MAFSNLTREINNGYINCEGQRRPAEEELAWQRTIEYLMDGMPCVTAIFERWKEEKPLDGIHVLITIHSTPASLLGYISILEAGAVVLAIPHFYSLSHSKWEIRALQLLQSNYGSRFLFTLPNENSRLDTVVTYAKMFKPDALCLHRAYELTPRLIESVPLARGAVILTTAGLSKVQKLRLNKPVIVIPHTSVKKVIEAPEDARQLLISTELLTRTTLRNQIVMVVGGGGELGRHLVDVLYRTGSKVYVGERENWDDPELELCWHRMGIKVFRDPEWKRKISVCRVLFTVTGKEGIITLDDLRGRASNGLILVDGGSGDLAQLYDELKRHCHRCQLIGFDGLEEFNIGDGRGVRIVAKGQPVDLEGDRVGVPIDIFDPVLAYYLLSFGRLFKNPPLGPGLQSPPREIQQEIMKSLLDSPARDHGNVGEENESVE